MITAEVFLTKDPSARRLLIVAISLLMVELVVNLALIAVMFAKKENYGYYTPLTLSILSTILGGVALGVTLTAWHACDANSGVWFVGSVTAGLAFAGMLAFFVNHLSPNDDVYIDQWPTKGAAQSAPSSIPLPYPATPAPAATSTTTTAGKKPRQQQYTNLTGK